MAQEKMSLNQVLNGKYKFAVRDTSLPTSTKSLSVSQLSIKSKLQENYF
jgi:hypothetical protein